MEDFGEMVEDRKAGGRGVVLVVVEALGSQVLDERALPRFAPFRTRLGG